MSRSAFAAMVLSVLTFLPPSWAVTNAVVGPCHFGTTFTTIQSAIDAADAGSTVLICPGNYPEVLTITKDLNLKGIVFNNSNRVLISVPGGGVPQNAVSGIWGQLAAHILVQKATVNLSNLTIDTGGLNTCATSVNPVSVLFQAASGSMTNSVFRSIAGCNSPIHALIDLTTNFKFSNNYLINCVNICLEVDYGTETTVSGNLISPDQSTVMGIETQLLGGPTTISGNTLAGSLINGIVVQTSPSVTVTGNSVVLPGGAGSAIVLLKATQSVVQSNRVTGGSSVIVVDDAGGLGGNVISKNKILNGSCGLALRNLQGDTTSGNAFSNEDLNMCK